MVWSWAGERSRVPTGRSYDSLARQLPSSGRGHDVQRTTAAATSTPIPSTASTVQRVRDLLSPRSTPGGFRLAAAVATVVCALCGILAASAISARSGSIDSAATAAEQLVGVQQIRVAAVEADSIAASSYLADSVAQAVLRGTYEDRLARGHAACSPTSPSGRPPATSRRWPPPTPPSPRSPALSSNRGRTTSRASRSVPPTSARRRRSSPTTCSPPSTPSTWPAANGSTTRSATPPATA